MEKMIQVTNRDSGDVGYTLPDSGLHRVFAPGETKTVPLSELQALQWVPGGEFTLRELLIVNNRDALSALNMEVEPEYFYTEADIRKILLEGTLDQLEDTLNFAPEGVIDLIKKIAVETELPDTRKRKMITAKTNFNIDNAIHVNTVMNTEDDNTNVEDKVRKTTPIVKTEPAAPARKTTPQYKVVTPQ